MITISKFFIKSKFFEHIYKGITNNQENDKQTKPYSEYLNDLVASKFQLNFQIGNSPHSFLDHPKFLEHVIELSMLILPQSTFYLVVLDKVYPAVKEYKKGI